MFQISGTLIDHIGFSSHVTSLSMSPTSDFLATTHSNDLGIYLWSNKSLYGHVSLKPLDQSESQPVHIKMPTVKHAQEEILSGAMEQMEMEEQEMEEMEESWNLSQIQDLVTLANLPPARWQNLHNLEVIKARNKPKEVVSKPQNAPFFLPTISNVEGKIHFNLADEQDQEKADEKKQIFEENFTKFGQKLWDTSDLNEHFNHLINELKGLGPSAIDMEVVALSPEGGGSIPLMCKFLKLLQICMEAHRDFEAVQAYLGLFLKHHSETVMENEDLIEALEELKPIMSRSWTDLKSSMSSAATLVSFAKNSLLTSG